MNDLLPEMVPLAELELRGWSATQVVRGAGESGRLAKRPARQIMGGGAVVVGLVKH